MKFATRPYSKLAFLRWCYVLQTLFLLALTAYVPCRAASPLEIQWQKSYSTLEGASGCVVRPASGGYIVLGSTSSGLSGDKTTPAFGGFDFWVLRLNAEGQILWQQTHGGSGTDQALDVLVQPQGFVLMGISDSSSGGNKTNANLGLLADPWLVGLDQNGNKLWDRTAGTDRFDSGASVTLGSGNRVLVSAYSRPTANPPHVDSYLWFVGQNGTILSNFYVFGRQTNEVESSIETLDGNYILAGESRNAGGSGGLDWWIARLNAAGVVSWEKTFGGTNNDFVKMVRETPDHGLLVAGYTTSGASGTKTSPGYGSNDFWFVRLDVSGNKLWERSAGGSGNDQFSSLCILPDGGFLAVGASDSPPNGTKTAPNFGGLDGWLVRFDAAGNQLWDRSFGGTNLDGINSVQQTSDGGFILGADTLSGISGNKTIPLFGPVDMWIIKIASEAPSLALERCCQDDLGPRWNVLLNGISNVSYRTEISSNLVDWLPFRTNQVTGPRTIVTDVGYSPLPARYFRVRQLP